MNRLDIVFGDDVECEIVMAVGKGLNITESSLEKSLKGVSMAWRIGFFSRW